MNVYDFDKTIYDGDSSIDFFVFELKKNIKVFLKLLHIVKAYILYRLGKLKKKELKEIFFSFLYQLDNPMYEVECFVKQNMKKIKKWYLMRMKSDDIIITASPEYLVQFFMNELLGQKCIGTRMDMSTGMIHGENCYGEEKVIRYREMYGKKPIDEFYTDSTSDMPMILLAKNSYLIKKNEIICIKNCQ